MWYNKEWSVWRVGVNECVCVCVSVSVSLTAHLPWRAQRNSIMWDDHMTSLTTRELGRLLSLSLSLSLSSILSQKCHVTTALAPVPISVSRASPQHTHTHTHQLEPVDFSQAWKTFSCGSDHLCVCGHMTANDKQPADVTESESRDTPPVMWTWRNAHTHTQGCNHYRFCWYDYSLRNHHGFTIIMHSLISQKCIKIKWTLFRF